VPALPPTGGGEGWVFAEKGASGVVGGNSGQHLGDPGAGAAPVQQSRELGEHISRATEQQGEIGSGSGLEGGNS